MNKRWQNCQIYPWLVTTRDTTHNVERSVIECFILDISHPNLFAHNCGQFVLIVRLEVSHLIKDLNAYWCDFAHLLYIFSYGHSIYANRAWQLKSLQRDNRITREYIIARIANNSQMDTCCAGGKKWNISYKLDKCYSSGHSTRYPLELSNLRRQRRINRLTESVW